LNREPINHVDVGNPSVEIQSPMNSVLLVFGNCKNGGSDVLQLATPEGVLD
jgi:hypothetical protein